MKVKIKQEVFEESLSKGAAATLSEEAQSDTSGMSLLIKSIRITCNKNFIVEGSTDLIGIKYSIPATEENGITVEDPGCILVPAKELIDWVKFQPKDSVIGMSLSELNTPEIINPLEGIEVEDSEDLTIKKIGSVKLVSKNSSKSARKWELDCYDPAQRQMVNFSNDQKGQKHFDINSDILSAALSKISFVAVKKDYEHLIDSISVQSYKNSVYFSTTDTKRCALYKVPSSEISNLESNKPLLVSANLLDLASKTSNKKTTLSFYYNENTEKLFIAQPNIDIRIVGAEKNSINKFPDIKILLEKAYKPLGKVSKFDLNTDLTCCFLVNPSSALFSFSSDKSTLVMKAKSDSSKADADTRSYMSNLSSSLKAVWGVTHLMDALNIIEDDQIELHVPDNMKSVKVKGENDDCFLYFAMSINNPKYETSKADD